MWLKLRRRSAEHADCHQQGSIPLYRARHSRGLSAGFVAFRGRPERLRCSLRRGPAQVRKKVPYGKAHSSTPPLCKVRHLRFTSDITRGMWSQTQRRGSCDGLCEHRIDDVARRGVRRHLWWRASAVSRRCTQASLGPLGSTASLASGRTASRGHERRAAPRS